MNISGSLRRVPTARTGAVVIRAPGKAAIHSATRAWRGWCALVWAKPRCCQDALRPRTILAMSGVCHGSDGARCPGGDLGTCASRRLNTSVACGVCEVGTRPSPDGPCVGV